MNIRLTLFAILFLCSFSLSAQLFVGEGGEVSFVSDAPLEEIVARSNSLRGAINLDDQTFAFTIDIATFEGFNSPLQREHFNEKYMESTRFPKATFRGKIIESIDVGVGGTQSIRAKGVFSIHGVSQERIIRSTIRRTANGFQVDAKFDILLEEHQIEVPRIVFENIAQEIAVALSINFQAQRGSSSGR
ncbi:MAG: YceI family protein [Bacteroidota bacterium]